MEARSFLIHICLGLIMAKAWLMRHRDPGLHTLSHTHARVTGQSGTVREWKLLTVHLHHLAAAVEMFGFLAHLLKTSKAAGWWKNSCKLCQVSHWTTHRPATFFYWLLWMCVNNFGSLILGGRCWTAQQLAQKQRAARMICQRIPNDFLFYK